MKDDELWSIKSPEGLLFPAIAELSKRGAIALLEIAHEDNWPNLRKQGWRAVKVKLVEI